MPADRLSMHKVREVLRLSSTTSLTWTPQNIGLLREFLGDSLTDFAKRCGTTRRATIAEWESGRKIPSDTVKVLFDYMATTHGFTPHRLAMLTRSAVTEVSANDGE